MTATFKFTLTTYGKVDRLIKFIKGNQFFFGFGKSTVWDSTWGVGVDDAHPPTPDPNSLDIPEMFAYKRARVVLPAVASQCGPLTFQTCSDVLVQGKQYQTVDLSNTIEVLREVFPKQIYVEADLTPSDYFGNLSFRAFGLYLNPVFKAGVSTNKLIYQPQELVTPGIAYNLTYNSPILQKLNKNTIINLLLTL